MNCSRSALAAALSALLAGQGGFAAQPGEDTAILHVRVLEGEGAVHPVGGRASGALVVQVTDETGRPVEGAAVTFRLPEEGPGGTFASGMRTEVAVTARDGRAAVWGIQWNHAPGPFQIRVTAVRRQVRAGAVVAQYLSDAVPARPARSGQSWFTPPRSRTRWIYGLALVAAGAAAGGLAMRVARDSNSSPATAAGAEPVVAIQAPVITIGRP